MNAAINGVGILSACGRGTDALRAALLAGWRPPASVQVPGGGALPVYSLPPVRSRTNRLAEKSGARIASQRPLCLPPGTP